MPVVQFANERRRGWEEAPDSPPRDPQDFWDQHRNARLQKRQPGGDRLLCLESLGWAGGEFGVDQAVDGMRVAYSLEVDGEVQLLHHLQWADWDREGHLLVATRSGSGISMAMSRNYCSKKIYLSPNRTLPPRQHGRSDGEGSERRPIGQGEILTGPHIRAAASGSAPGGSSS